MFIVLLNDSGVPETAIGAVAAPGVAPRLAEPIEMGAATAAAELLAGEYEGRSCSDSVGGINC